MQEEPSEYSRALARESSAMTPLTDAQLAAMRSRYEWVEEHGALPSDLLPALIDRYLLLDHSAALAAHLAEAEQTIEKRIATIHGLSKIIDAHEAEVEDLAQRCDKATTQLAAAQATIERLTAFIKDIEWLGHSFDVGQHYLHCLICQGIKGRTGHTPHCQLAALLGPAE